MGGGWLEKALGEGIKDSGGNCSRHILQSWTPEGEASRWLLDASAETVGKQQWGGMTEKKKKMTELCEWCKMCEKSAV